ncbi:polysaccharide biosynthesis protein [Tabrizicola oligotrophica]|uniref:Polysaccharide biosynthesis protein n=1 Tax=Tabrizicola oligotrophica TaxID=2710650 RepID=A0A6M0QTP5_9RHOB|nr:nucleoside-diphosphate sugar epimerase/dehydratase [Tabrizicola oligotrophica]NEY90849.1 polysaccharide biosynthesis protein [Tabrizicola oligotrophica]
MAIQFIADGLAMCLSFVAAMWLRQDSLAFLGNPHLFLALVPAIPVALLVLHGLGFYRAVIRYIVVRALKSVLLAALASGGTLALTAQFLALPIPFSVSVMYAILAFLTVGSSRYVFREAAYQTQNPYRERVVIYGAGAAGRQLVQTLRQGTDYLPIAFLDDDPRTHGTMVAGFRVHPPEKIDQLIRNNSVTSVLLAIPSASKARRSEVLKWLEQFPLHLRTVPGLHDIVTGVARIDELNEVAIEDLLGRDPVPPREDLLGANITGKSVLVTGAGGSIGSELCRQILRQRPHRLVLLDISEPALYDIEQELGLIRAHEKQAVEIAAVLGSVQNRGLLERTMRRFGVQTVYHAAAYKHVPLVEHNIAEGLRNNVHGTRVAVEAAVTCGVEAFILISTDKAVRPANIMGASKRLAEMVCQALSRAPHVRTRISMVRFGNVLGSSGSVIPLFRRQIAAGGPITVTHPEITRFFMTIPEAAQLVIQAGAMAQGGDVFVLDMGEPLRITELAAQMARLHGLKAVLVSESTPVGPGEIGIVFTRLRPGEKLYEELLIGNSPQATAHPRILTTTELHPSLAEIVRLLELLDSACNRSDIAAIRRLLVEAQTDYLPYCDVVDHFGTEAATADPDAERPASESKRLTVIAGGTPRP